MNNNFLISSPLLNQAFESQVSAGGGITRRSFIKRTGGATVATLVAWNVASLESARADTNSTSNASASYEWRLVCVKDPTRVGAQAGEHGNNGAAHPSRQWFYRNIATWDDGDDAVCLEIRGTGPVACAKDALGAYIITDEEVRVSFTVTGSIKAYANDDADDGDNYWDGVFQDDPTGWEDNSDDDKVAYDEDSLGDGTLSINKKTGEVSFVPAPLIFTPLQNAFDGGNFQLVGGGGVTPAIQVVGGVARANIDDVTWEIGFSAGAGITPGEEGGGGGNVGLNFKLTFKNLPVSTQRTLDWNFNRVRRPVGTKDPWEDMGLAWPSNFSMQDSQLPAPYKPS